MPRLYVDKSWFVEVDEQGYYKGPIGEGAFGSVLCVRGSGLPGSQVRAWKLPRLLADTVEENAYIEGILSQESTLVMWVMSEEAAGDANSLVRCLDDQPAGEFWDRRRFSGYHAEVQKQDGHVFFAQFQKGRPPRLCLVNFERGLSVFPEGAESAIEQVLTHESWKKLAGSSDLQFGKACYLAEPQHEQIRSVSSTVIVGDLRSAGASKQPFSSWFTGISSILWEWATMNLQEAISRGLLKAWTIDDHFLLWNRILDGVLCLHSNELLHADLRPANIFCIGSPIKGSNYKLGDYGSLSAGEGFAGGSKLHAGDTEIGPDVGRGRTSPFYAPERRSGVERETADTAVVVFDREQNEYRIWLGWKSQVVDDDGKVKQEVCEAIRQLVPDDPPYQSLPFALDSLRPGDRIRLRDQVYRVKRLVQSIGALDGGLFCICYAKYATVVHDRLTIYTLLDPKDINPSDEPQVIPLSSYIELRQWSAATDLFSLGALFLYTLYTVGRQKGFLPKHGTKDDASTYDLRTMTASEIMVIIDAEFRQSMAVLESVPYLKVLWEDLDGLWGEIVEAHNQALKQDTTEKKRAIYETLSQSLRDKNRLLTVVSNITASVPNAKVILQYFDCNTVRFVLFLHFILRCLHRSDDLETTGISSHTLPFSKERTESPSAEGAAFKARNALAELQNLLRDEYLFDERVSIQNVPDYDVRSEYLVKIDNDKLREENQKLLQETATMSELSKENIQLRRGLDDVNQQNQQLNDENQEFRNWILKTVNELSEKRKRCQAKGWDWKGRRHELFVKIDEIIAEVERS
ncbi:MAG TPA: hypothetical protein VJ875_03070 [Pyrinomonadaceae bacterium]|nr:hypothetical protein [Pyrinomonadaceae bacterium]